MTISKSRRHIALPDTDPSVALAQVARFDARQDLARGPACQDFVAQVKIERAAYIMALLRRFGSWIKFHFRLRPASVAADSPIREGLGA